MRLSRPCFDKPWRCPGWAGGGAKYARKERCDNGRIRGWGIHDDRLVRPEWHFLRCDTCDVVTIPFALRWLFPEQWRWYALWKWRELRNWRDNRKRGWR